MDSSPLTLLGQVAVEVLLGAEPCKELLREVLLCRLLLDH